MSDEKECPECGAPIWKVKGCCGDEYTVYGCNCNEEKKG